MIPGIPQWLRQKKIIVGTAILVLSGLGFGAFRMANSAVTLPTAEVKRKDFLDTLEIKGEVKALRSVVIIAPYGAGDLQIVSLVANSAKVKKGDLIVEFDATTIKQKLAQDQSSVKSAEAQVAAAREGVELSEKELAQARRRYEAGVTNSIEVTDAQTRLQRARDNLTNALYNHNLSRIDLSTAMGTIQALVDNF